MKKIVDPVLLDRISSRMSKTFGQIHKNEMEEYYHELMAMEFNLLKLHRQDPSRNSRRAKEAIKYSLLTIDGTLRDVHYDFGTTFTKETEALLHGLLYSFDPFYSQEIGEVLEKKMDLKNKDVLKEYYTRPVQCLLKLEESIDLWIEQLGSNGYFRFLEDVIGDEVKGDRLTFSVNINVDLFYDSSELKRKFHKEEGDTLYMNIEP